MALQPFWFPITVDKYKQNKTENAIFSPMQEFHTACLIWMALDFLVQKSPLFLFYHFVFNLVNSFFKRAVQNPNTSDVGKHQIQI